MQNTVKFIDTLLLLLEDVDIILLQPQNSSTQDPRYRNFRVRKGVILSWLQYLKQHHPGYCSVSISTENLSQLLKDRDVTDCILAIKEEADQAPSENYFVISRGCNQCWRSSLHRICCP